MSEHRCDTGHFDRSICPEPCGMMHSFCATCGKRQDRCAHEPESTPTEREGVAEVLVDHWPHPVFGCECTPTDDETGQKEILDGSWEDHLADALAPLIAERERRAAETALREAADELGRGVTYEGGYIDTIILPDDLRDRADRIGGEG